jgi:hypothetical protein
MCVLAADNEMEERCCARGGGSWSEMNGGRQKYVLTILIILVNGRRPDIIRASARPRASETRKNEPSRDNNIIRLEQLEIDYLYNIFFEE